MKRTLLFVLCIASALFVQCKKDEASVTIGVDLPLTGKYEYWGNEFKSGAEIYCRQNEKLKVVFEDNMGVPATSATVAKRLIDFNKVDALVSLFAPFSFNLREMAETAGIPLISSFNSSTAFTGGFPHSYTDFATHDMQLPLLVDCVTDSLNLRKGVYYCVNDDYGLDGAKILTQLMGEKGIPISGELFMTDVANHRNALAKIMKDDADFIFLIARNQDLITAVNQIRERNPDILILGVGSFDAPEIWAGIPAQNQQNILFASSYFEKDYSDESRKFYDEFYKQKQRDPNYPAVFGYTICQYLAECIAQSKEQGVPLTDILNRLDRESIRGQIKMTDRHIVYSSIAIYERKDGKSVPVAIEMKMPERD